jgi:RNA polymerase sigma-70 factor (ECF subfamily)
MEQLEHEKENISIEDSVLVGLCQQGDSAATERLIIRYQDRIYNVILRICGNSDDAAELTQETFVKLIEKIDTFAGKSSFYTWLFRIAVNITLNYCKRRFKFSVQSLDSVAGAISDDGKARFGAYFADDSVGDPAILAQNKEVGELVFSSLNKLESKHRAVLVLREIEGMSYLEIAESLNVELGTVKSRISRARVALREILETVL